MACPYVDLLSLCIALFALLPLLQCKLTTPPFSELVMTSFVESQPPIPPSYSRAFEVNRPPRLHPERDHVRSCTVPLLDHSFENSYYHPATMRYSPALFDDSDCRDPSKWKFIQLDVHGSAKGRQFDRLGSVQLEGVEILRHCTQEPGKNGTRWDFSKEMNKYYDLFRKDGTLLFYLPNIVNENYTSPLRFTLSLTVYVAKNGEASMLRPLAEDYAVILPLSTRNDTDYAFFTVGDDVHDVDEHRIARQEAVTRVRFPHNARSAIVEIYASGTAKDEVWYGNAPNEYYETIEGDRDDVTYARGPLREVQLTIDGRLAGVVYPYPTIFTGAFSPLLWRPQVSFGAFDQPTYLLDVTPFIGTLTDGEEHDFGLQVVSAEVNKSVHAWFVSGNVQVQLDTSDERTTGRITAYQAPLTGDFAVSGTVQGDIVNNGSLHVELRTRVPRLIQIEGSYQVGSKDTPSTASIRQSITYGNVNDMSPNTSSLAQSAHGSYASLHDDGQFLAYQFDYPIAVATHGPNTTIDHAYNVELWMCPDASATFKEPGYQKVEVRQQGEAKFFEIDPLHFGGALASTSISYRYADSNGYTFIRTNVAFNRTVTHDEVQGTLASQAGPIS